MILLRPWLLLLLAAVAAWAAWDWKHTSRRAALALKAAMLALVVLALAEPRLTVFEQRVAVALLADTSASVPAADLEKQSEFIGRVRGERGRHHLQVIPFAADTRPLRSGESEQQLRGEGRSTNLENAIRNGIASLPEGRVPRLLLASDGQENQGSVERAIYQARLLGVPVDTWALPGTHRPSLRLESVTLPPQAFRGEKFTVEIEIESPRAASATVEITADGKRIGLAPAALQQGATTVRVRAQVDTEGATLLRGRIAAGDLGELRFHRAIVLRRPRLLLVTRDGADVLRHLRQTLAAARFEVVESPGALPTSLAEFQVVLLNNHHLESFPTEEKARLEEFVRDGGGFGLVAGENNVYVENKHVEDPLDRMLPARLSPPRTPEGTVVVLVIDKSSSMEGKKMELARMSAIGVVENLRPIDQVGVLIFDNSFQWAVPVRKADNPALLKRLIASITPDGGTQIAPALAEGFRQIQRIKGVYRHIVLLTDGISEEGDSMALAKEAANARVTISTVGLGQDVNRAYLEKVAALAKGKSYFVLDLTNLEQLLLRDVMEHTGSSAVEKPVQAAVVRDVEMLEDVGMAQAPPLLGYLKFVAKPQAETILQVDAKDPLLARWQYGLGRSAVFASDAKARWATNWVGWSGFDRFWANLLRDLLPRARGTEATVVFNSASNELVVRYRLQPGAQATPPADIYTWGTDGFRKTAPLERVGPAVYQAHVPIEDHQGLFRLRPAVESREFPEIGYYREETELAQYGSNTELLRQIARATGGRFNPAPREVFDAGNRAVSRTMDLWPALLALAVLCNLLELAARKGWLPKVS